MYAIPLSGNATLQPLEPWQAEHFLANINRCREHITPWVGPSFVPADLAGARRVLQRYADGQAADNRRIFGIWKDGNLVGGTMFVSYDTDQGVCEVGCWLEASAEGHGLVNQAVRHMLDWAFKVRGLHRAEWWTLPDNERSINAAKRLGMSLDGTLRQWGKGPDGRRVDEQVWSVLADEWTSATS